MDLKNRNPPTFASEAKEPSFLAKMRGALVLSGKSFSLSYKSSKLWQGYLISIISTVLLSFVLSTSTYSLFMELFPHFIFSISFLGVTIWISFSPLFFFLSFLIISGIWLMISFILSHFRKLQVRRTASALGFALTPLFILIFYILNKFFLQSFKYELGPFLISIGLGWSLISGLIGVTRLIGFEFGGLFNYSIKSIIYRKKRTYASIIGITVAIGLIITPIPLISGYYSQLNYLAQNNQYSQYLILLENGKSDYYSSNINSSFLSSLNHSNIASISPETYMNVNLSLNISYYQLNLRGINYSIFQNFRESLLIQILPAKTFSDEQILMGSLLASILNISYSDLPINVTLSYNLKNWNVTIVGLVTSNIQYDIELIAPNNLTWVLKPELFDKFSLIEVKLEDPALVDSTIQTLQTENPTLDVNRENQLNDFVSNIISKMIRSVWLLSIVIYVVMSFGMYHIMQTIIKESKKEIAIIKSVGASRFQILRMFLYQTILLCLIGSTFGVISGIILSYAASIIVSNITNIIIQPVFNIFIISFSIMLGIAAGILGSMYPAYKAAIKPIGEIIK